MLILARLDIALSNIFDDVELLSGLWELEGDS